MEIKEFVRAGTLDVVGLYTEGHVDKEIFLSLIRFGIREGVYEDAYDNSSYNRTKTYPVTLPYIHYKYYLLEPETILSDTESEDYLPITIYFF